MPPLRKDKGKGQSRPDSPVIRGSTPTSIPLSSADRIDSGLTGPPGGKPLNYKSPEPSVHVKSEAIQKYIGDLLGDDDKTAFKVATDVMDRLREQQWDKLRGSRSHIIHMRQCVDQFLGSIAICIQYDPQLSSLLEGGLNCILTVSAYPIYLIFI